jgi:hypothetical protein
MNIKKEEDVVQIVLQEGDKKPSPLKLKKNANSKLDLGVGGCATPILQGDLMDLLSPSRYKIV